MPDTKQIRDDLDKLRDTKEQQEYELFRLQTRRRRLVIVTRTNPRAGGTQGLVDELKSIEETIEARRVEYQATVHDLDLMRAALLKDQPGGGATFVDVGAYIRRKKAQEG